MASLDSSGVSGAIAGHTIASGSIVRGAIAGCAIASGVKNLSKTDSLVPALASAPVLTGPYFLFGFVLTDDLLRGSQVVHRS